MSIGVTKAWCFVQHTPQRRHSIGADSLLAALDLFLLRPMLKPLSQPLGGRFRRQYADVFVLQYLVVKLVARLD